MIGLILDKLLRLIDAETGTHEAPILPDQAKGYFSSYFQAWRGSSQTPRPSTTAGRIALAGHAFANAPLRGPFLPHSKETY
jgi:hypothetical protein